MDLFGARLSSSAACAMDRLGGFGFSLGVVVPQSVPNSVRSVRSPGSRSDDPSSPLRPYLAVSIDPAFLFPKRRHLRRPRSCLLAPRKDSPSKSSHERSSSVFSEAVTTAGWKPRAAYRPTRAWNGSSPPLARDLLRRNPRRGRARSVLGARWRVGSAGKLGVR